MRHEKYSASSIVTLLREQTIATMAELMSALGTGARRTVFRKLKGLGYRTSYSHRGRYYTLDEVAEFDDRGICSFEGVWFSIHGTLLSTAAEMVGKAPAGLYVDELDNLLHVGTKDALRKLVADARLAREEVSGRFLYCDSNPALRQRQLLARRALFAEPGLVGPLPESSVMPEELRATIVLFYSLLDEKQRRLFAGLEALKTGHGGDVRIAELLGLDRATVARGRRELLGQDSDTTQIRRKGGGRKRVEKKRRS